jgi:hypothetical protein
MSSVSATLHRMRLFSRAHHAVTAAFAASTISVLYWRPDISAFVAIPAVMLMLLAHAVSDKQHAKLTERLMAPEDLEILGPLLEAVQYGGGRLSVGKELRRPLISLLLRVRARHAAIFEERHHECLRRILGDDRGLLLRLMETLQAGNMDFQREWFPESATLDRTVGVDVGSIDTDTVKIAVLRALAYIGDGRTLGTVQRLASSAWHVGVRSEAAECLSVLKKRVEMEGETGRLLRASQPSPETTLLQSVASATQDEALLLRSAGLSTGPSRELEQYNDLSARP